MYKQHRNKLINAFKGENGNSNNHIDEGNPPFVASSLPRRLPEGKYMKHEGKESYVFSL